MISNSQFLPGDSSPPSRFVPFVLPPWLCPAVSCHDELPGGRGAGHRSLEQRLPPRGPRGRQPPGARGRAGAHGLWGLEELSGEGDADPGLCEFTVAEDRSETWPGRIGAKLVPGWWCFSEDWRG